MASSSSFSYMTSHAFVTVCQFVCLHWEFAVSDPGCVPSSAGVGFVGWVVG